MTTDQFANIELNTKKESACSPVVEDDFRGLVIDAPEKIDLAAPWHESIGSEPRPVLPVCGTLSADLVWLSKFQSASNEIRLVAIDAKTSAPYAGLLLRKGFEPAINDPPTPEMLADWKKGGDTMTQWFNANAYYFLEDLPVAPTRYHIFATLGEWVSNVKTVEVVGKGDEGQRRKALTAEAMFGRAATPPAVEASFRGVKIAARKPSWPKSSPMWIDGVVQLDAKDAEALGPAPVQRSLVGLISVGFLEVIWNLPGERALFVDDQVSANGVVRGAFSAEIHAALGGQPAHDAYVLVAAGPHVSNVLALPPAP